MVRNSIRSRTVTFLAAQSVILGVIMLAFVTLASVLFVKNALRWQLNKIEQGVFMFAQQAAHSGTVPKRGDLGEYAFFILGQDGKYILPRLPRSDEGEKLWQEYESKLIYEMQKRRDGWSYYPERSGFDWRDGKYVIRYVYVEQQGWIVAAEGFLPSDWNMLKGFLTPKLFLGLFLVVCLAFLLMLLNAFWHFRKMMKAILRSQENNFIAVHPEIPEAARSQAPEEKPLGERVVRNMPEQVLPRVRTDRMGVPEGREREGVPAETEAAGQSRPGRKEMSASNARQADDLGNMSIDTEDLRSPLLKKVIQEMRGLKK